MAIYELLKKLIEKKYYENIEEIQNKLDVFFAMSKITDKEFEELTILAMDIYNPIVDEPIEEPIEELIQE